MGRKIRVLIAKPGLDGHDRGAKTIVHALREAGMEVIYTGLHKRVEEIVRTASEEDVDVIGLSILSGTHIPVTEQLLAQLGKEKIADKLVLVGGVIPEQDIGELQRLGAAGIFPTGTPYEDIISFIKEKIYGGEEED